MGKDPAFLFYPGDWLGGTMGMTFEEKGVYLELLILQFNRGHLTSHMIGQTVGQLWVTVEDKFVKDDKGLFFNERLDIEKAKRKNFINTRKNNLLGKNQYSKKEDKKEGHLGGQMTSHMENRNRNRNRNSNRDGDENEFDLFWNKYHQITKKPKTDKNTATKEWKKLKKEEKNNAFENIQKFYDSVKDEKYGNKYCNKAWTYLSKKCFNNEFPLPQPELTDEERTQQILKKL